MTPGTGAFCTADLFVRLVGIDGRHAEDILVGSVDRIVGLLEKTGTLTVHKQFGL